MISRAHCLRLYAGGEQYSTVQYSKVKKKEC